jgi:hypothetical protein
MAKFGKSHRLMNANGGGGGGFLANLGVKLPFGMSNIGNNAPVQPQNNNPNFPSKNQLDPKNQPDPITGQPGTEANNDPANNADPQKGQGSQLDNFKDLFKVQTDDKGNPQVPVDPLSGPLLTVDPQKLKEAASKLNFTGNIAPEQLQKAMSGQDPQAFMDVLNSVAQGAFLQAMQVNAGVVETAFQKHTSRIETALPDRIRNIQVRNAAPKHAALSHPAAAPMVEALKGQIARANPHLSPEKVAEHAENYFIAFASDVTAGNQQQSNGNKSGPQETDWAALLGGS